jgi:Hypothetical glycosyl hydrolase family 15
MRRRTLIAPAALAAATAVALSLSGLASAGSAAGTPAVVPWSYQATSPGNTYTQAQAVAQANRFAVIAANQNAYGTAAADMLKTNPSLRLLAYVNGAYAQNTQGSAYPASWYLRTASGAQVRSNGYGNYLMNVTNQAWVTTVIQHCQQAMAKTHYVGCFVDMLGTASITDGYTNGAPIDPVTHAVFSSSTWLGATAALARQVKRALGDSLVYVNGLGNGVRYFNSAAPSKQLLANIDGALAESWLRAAPSALSWYPTESSWLANVNMLTDAGKSGKGLLLTTKTWGSGTASQLAAWHAYAVASYLMAANGNAAFSFLATRTGDPTAADPMVTSLNLGAALGAYAKVGGVYQRSFANGKVLVNSTKVTVTVSLGAKYTDQNGKVMTSVTMAPNAAEILTAS